MKSIKRAVSSVLVIVMIMSTMITTIPTALNAATNHSQNEAVEWIKARGNESWWKDVDGAYGCQCVDLIMAYYEFLVGYRVGGNGCDYTWNSLPSGWYRDNTPTPGAVAVWGSDVDAGGWTTGSAGHVGLVYSVNENTIYTVETNVGNSQAAKYRERKANNVTTYIHPDFSLENSIDTRYNTPFTLPVNSDTDVPGYDAVNGNQIGVLWPDEKCTILEVYTNGWCKVRDSVDLIKYVPLNTFYVGSEFLTDFVDIGTDFYGVILNTEIWEPITVDSDNYVRLRNEINHASQLWYFQRQDDGSYVISSCLNGKALELTNGVLDEGNPVSTNSDDWGGYYQRWYIYERNGAYVFRSSHYFDENRVLTLENNCSDFGTPITTRTADDSVSQTWSIYTREEVQLSAPTLSVEVGSSAKDTIFTWNDVYGESGYSVRIWKDEIYNGDSYYDVWNANSGVGVTLPAGIYQAYVDAVNYYECKMSNVVTFTVNEAVYTNKIDLWACGFKNGEGNNNGKNARHLGSTYTERKEGSQFTLNADHCPAQIPNGFYLRESIGSGYSGEWIQYSFGTTFKQINSGMNFEYDCYPIDYTITYNLNGGTNSSSNPSTYNVLYGVTLENPTREGYTFAGWTDANGNKVTCINPGANADHSSAEELYSMLSTRTTGDQTLTANWIHDCANSLTWSDWTVTKAPTTSETGVESRYCSVCGEAETRELPVLIIPEVTTDNYVVTITLASDITAMRYAGGEHTTAGSIKSAPDRVDISESVIAKNTVDGRFVYTMPDGGYYTFWVRMKDGNEYLLAADMTEFIPSVDTYGVMVTVNDLYDIKDCFIAKGEFDSYNEIKDNGYIVRLTANKIAGKHSYTYTVSEPGMHTVLVRYNDGSEYIFHEELTVDEPVFTTNGLQVTVSNIPGVKVIRTAYGECYTPGDTKRAEGARNFSNKSVIKDAEEYMLQYREEGIVTIIVEYNNGYVKVFHYDVTKKTPTIEQNGNTVSFSDLDGLVMVRYAEGVYSTSSEIKKAKGSKVIKPDAIADGKISVTDLAVGTYTFCVQYDDDSYNYYTVTVD